MKKSEVTCINDMPLERAVGNLIALERMHVKECRLRREIVNNLRVLSDGEIGTAYLSLWMHEPCIDNMLLNN